MSFNLTFHPLTNERWPDLETLFGKNGAYAGCWCMWWRLKRKEFEKNQGDGNRAALRRLVDSGEVPGILAYDRRTPVAWCSVAPRDSYPSLNRSPVLKKLDDTPVWSSVCFFVAKPYRRQGMIQHLIHGAIDYVRQQGGKVIEAYPTVARSDRVPPVSSYIGLPDMFRAAGFVECKRASQSKLIMRYTIES